MKISKDSNSPPPTIELSTKKNKNNKNKNLSEKKNKGNDKIEDVGMQLTHNKIKDKLLCSWEFSYISFLLKKKKRERESFHEPDKGWGRVWKWKTETSGLIISRIQAIVTESYSCCVLYTIKFQVQSISIYIYIVMSNRGKTVISCTLYINNILCVRFTHQTLKHFHSKQHGIKVTKPPLPLTLRPPPTDIVVAGNHVPTR